MSCFNLGSLPDFNTVREHTLLEYVWLGGSGQDLRGKTKIMEGQIDDVSECPVWNYDGSSTGQAITTASEIKLVPVCMVKDPFRKAHHKIVLCECMRAGTNEPISGNHRHSARKVFEDCKDDETWFGIEQEFILYKYETQCLRYPLGFGRAGFAAPQGLYYCGVGAGYVFGRDVVEQAVRNMLWAGLNIAGINIEVFPGQWEYQVGICKGIEIADHLWLSRYILQRTMEPHNLFADFRPKPVEGDWNGSGCHTNYSTKASRNKGGYKKLLQYTDQMKKFHSEAMKLYGTGNEKRMTGEHETARYDEFSVGIGARGCSVRINNEMVENDCGYLEDRRPSSNIDPYLSCAFLADCTLNDGKHVERLLASHKAFVTKQEFTFQE